MDLAMPIFGFAVLGILLTFMFIGFFREMLNPEVSGMEFRILYDKIQKKVPQSEIYDRTSKIKNFKRICGGLNPVKWILPF